MKIDPSGFSQLLTDGRRYRKSFNTAGKNALHSSKVASFESDLLRTNEDIASQISVNLQTFVKWEASSFHHIMQTLVKFRDFCFSLTFKLREFANFKALFPAMSMDICHCSLSNHTLSHYSVTWHWIKTSLPIILSARNWLH